MSVRYPQTCEAEASLSSTHATPKLHGKRILITGGAGFIGTRLCVELCEANELLLYDNLRRDSLQFTSQRLRDQVDLVEGDVLDQENLKKVISRFKPEFILHLAAIAGIDSVVKSPTTTMTINFMGTYHVLEAAKSLVDKIDRFVSFSTSEVYGAYAYKVRETQSANVGEVGPARWTYAVSKLAAEHLVHSYHQEFGLRTVSLRPFNVYGPGQVGESAIHGFVTRALADQLLEIHGDGAQVRSWCYIDDAVQGVIASLVTEDAIGNVFNIGNPRATVTVKSLAEQIVQLSDSASSIVHVPKDDVDVELRVPSIEKAERILGFHPEYDLKEGLERTIRWYKERLKDD